MAFTRLKNALIRARFAWSIALLGSVVWALVLFVSACASLWLLRGFGHWGQILTIAALYSLGGLLAFAPALYAARIIAPHKGKWRLIAIAVSLLVFTLGATAIVMALQYRIYFVQWHAPVFTTLWVWQQIFTTAGAVYQYLVVGARAYLPLAPMGLIAISLWANRLAH